MSGYGDFNYYPNFDSNNNNCINNNPNNNYNQNYNQNFNNSYNNNYPPMNNGRQYNNFGGNQGGGYNNFPQSRYDSGYDSMSYNNQYQQYNNNYNNQMDSNNGGGQYNNNYQYQGGEGHTVNNAPSYGNRNPAPRQCNNNPNLPESLAPNGMDFSTTYGTEYQNRPNNASNSGGCGPGGCNNSYRDPPCQGRVCQDNNGYYDENSIDNNPKLRIPSMPPCDHLMDEAAGYETMQCLCTLCDCQYHNCCNINESRGFGVSCDDKHCHCGFCSACRPQCAPPMDFTTTYQKEYYERDCQPREARKEAVGYAPPEGDLDFCTTYCEEYIPRAHQPRKVEAPTHGYNAPEGDLDFCTTYCEEYIPRAHQPRRKETQSYDAPEGDLDFCTTYCEEYIPRAHQPRKIRDKTVPYSAPEGDLDFCTTYCEEYIPRAHQPRKPQASSYSAPEGDLDFCTTYCEEYIPREGPVRKKPESTSYVKPEGDMDFCTTYCEEYIPRERIKKKDCCPCCACCTFDKRGYQMVCKDGHYFYKLPENRRWPQDDIPPHLRGKPRIGTNNGGTDPTMPHHTGLHDKLGSTPYLPHNQNPRPRPDHIRV